MGEGSLERSLERHHMTHPDRHENPASLLPRRHSAHQKLMLEIIEVARKSVVPMKDEFG